MTRKQQMDALCEQVHQMSTAEKSVTLHGLLGWFEAVADGIDNEDFTKGASEQRQIDAFEVFIRAAQESISFRQRTTQQQVAK